MCADETWPESIQIRRVRGVGRGVDDPATETALRLPSRRRRASQPQPAAACSGCGERHSSSESASASTSESYGESDSDGDSAGDSGGGCEFNSGGPRVGPRSVVAALRAAQLRSLESICADLGARHGSMWATAAALERLAREAARAAAGPGDATGSVATAAAPGPGGGAPAPAEAAAALESLAASLRCEAALAAAGRAGLTPGASPEALALATRVAGGAGWHGDRPAFAAVARRVQATADAG